MAKVLHRFNISYTAVSHLAFCTPCGGPASCVFPMVLRSGASRSATLHRRPAQKQLRNGGPAGSVFPMALCRSATSAISLFPMVLRSGGLASCVFLMVLLPASPPRRPGQQHLPDSSLPQCRHPLRHGAPASNKPHPAEIRRWRRQSVQRGRKICVCLSSSSMWQQRRMRTYIIRCGKGRIPMLRVSKSGPDAPDC